MLWFMHKCEINKKNRVIQGGSQSGAVFKRCAKSESDA